MDGGAEIVIELSIGKGLMGQDGFDDFVLVVHSRLKGAADAVVDELEHRRILLGEGLVGHPEGVDHFLTGHFFPFVAQVVVVKVWLFMMVEPEGVVADEQRGRRILGDGSLGGDVAYEVVGNCAIGPAQDDLEQAVGSGRFSRQDDFVIFDVVDGLAGDQQDALNRSIRADADVWQDDEVFAVAGVDYRGYARNVETVIDNVIVENGWYTTRDGKPLVGAVGVAPGKWQYVQKIDMSNSGTAHRFSSFSLQLVVLLYLIISCARRKISGQM